MEGMLLIDPIAVPHTLQPNVLRALNQKLTDRELRFLISNLSAWDVTCSGTVSYKDILHALRLSKIEVMDVTETGGYVPSQVRRNVRCLWRGAREAWPGKRPGAATAATVALLIF